MRLRRLSAAGALSIFLCACGGSNAPTPPTTPSSPTAVSVSGTLTGFYDTSKRYSGTTATLATVPPMIATVNAAGRFDFASVPPGIYALAFTGPEHVDRAVKVQIVSGGGNDLGTIDAVERTVGEFEFRTPKADELMRAPTQALGLASSRWVITPTVYVDVDSLEPFQSSVIFGPGGTCPTPTGRLLETIRDAVNVRAPELTGGRMRPALVEVRPSSSMPAARSAGTITVRGGTLPGTLGGAADWEFNSRNEIVWGAIVLATVNAAGGLGNTDRTIAAHELGHTFGWSHTTIGLSIMGESGHRSCLPSLEDKMYGEYHYRRPPGTRSPDDTTAVETIVGQIR
jgi:hypothetical protein